jgi:hypothetical protein
MADGGGSMEVQFVASIAPIVRDADVAAAAAELTAKGYRLIHEARTEPWGQVTARLLSPEDLLVAVCYTPSFHDTGGP